MKRMAWDRPVREGLLDSVALTLLLVLSLDTKGIGADDDRPPTNATPARIVAGTPVVLCEGRVVLRSVRPQSTAAERSPFEEKSPFKLDQLLPAPPPKSTTMPAEDFLFRVQRLNGDRVLITTRDGRSRGWVKVEQLVAEDKAEAHFGLKIQKNSRDAAALVFRARFRMAKQKWNDALTDLDAAIHIDPKNALAFRLRSDVCLMLGDVNGAFDDFDRSDKLNSQDAKFLLKRARERLERTETGLALVNIAEAERIDARTPRFR